MNLSSISSKVSNYFFPTTQLAGKQQGNVTRDLRNTISPVQLQRIRQDIQSWRDSITEAELAILPHRVRMQRMYIDTVLDGHVKACMSKRKDLSMLREWSLVDSKGKEDTRMKELLNKSWFMQFIEYALEAKFYGYSLIVLGDLVNSEFPEMGIVRRFNVSPDRLNVAPFVYSVSGQQFLEGELAKWCVWVPTSSDVGVSKVGYGELYSVARYEIILRNILGQNTDAAELYGAPMIWAKTSKTEEAERNSLEAALASRGSAGYMITDPMDELELFESRGNGAGFKIYPDLEQRIEKKISKLLLGHADAIDSTPGKLGSSGDAGPAEIALRDKQTHDGIFLENVINGTLLPKLSDLGFPVDFSYRFKFGNNAEENEKRENEDKNNKLTTDVIYQLKQSGFEVDADYITKRTGIPVTKLAETPATTQPKFSDAVKNQLHELYSGTHKH